jgi:hypothetical protein
MGERGYEGLMGEGEGVLVRCTSFEVYLPMDLCDFSGRDSQWTPTELQGQQRKTDCIQPRKTRVNGIQRSY